MSTVIQEMPAIEEISKQMGATAGQVEKASKRAISATVRWAEMAGRRALARELHLGISRLQGRIKIYLRIGRDGVGKAWFGLNDLSSSRLNPVKTATGARMEGLGTVPGAFVGRARNGKTFAWTRRGPGRLPIDPIRMPIQEKGDSVLSGEVFPAAEAKFLEFFQRELEREAFK